MKLFILIALLAVTQPAYAAPQWVTNFEERHPKWAMATGVRLVHTGCFAIKHPKEFGKRSEQDGTNGMMSFFGAAANIVTSAVISAKRF